MSVSNDALRAERQLLAARGLQKQTEALTHLVQQGHLQLRAPVETVAKMIINLIFGLGLGAMTTDDVDHGLSDDARAQLFAALGLP